MRYNGTVKVELYDRHMGRPDPAFTALVDIDIDELADPLQSLTVAALEQALEKARTMVKYSGGHA